MRERLRSADVSFYCREGRTTPQHVGGLAVFQTPDAGLDYDRLVRLLEERISLVPRYRQKLRTGPGRLASPVWIDDRAFDISYHVRRSAMPRPGTDDALLEFCARIQSRGLDRNRPLWEMYFVEGLAGDRVAIVTKTHHLMVDGFGAVDVAQVLLDASPQPRRTAGAVWMPEPEPTRTALVADALTGVLLRPAALADLVRLGVRDARSSTARMAGAARGARHTASSALRRPADSPLHVEVGEQRRLAIARTSLDDYRQVRRAHGGTVHEVVLATVTGALRSWLIARGQALRPTAMVRALVPGSGGARDRVSALLVDLPVGTADSLQRLAHIQLASQGHADSGRSVGADALVALGGFAPPTLHALGARAANELTRRLFSLVISNAPGPQFPMYAAGARMTEMFPFLPLGRGQALSVAVTSYDGRVFYGINADRDATPDVALFAALITDSLAELVSASEQELARAEGALRRSVRTTTKESR
ncbi:MAG: wax ester/triacylglycerol synthase family O-acyltransferase [Jatrophihabitantaceae bacterium]